MILLEGHRKAAFDFHDRKRVVACFVHVGSILFQAVNYGVAAEAQKIFSRTLILVNNMARSLSARVALSNLYL